VAAAKNATICWLVCGVERMGSPLGLLRLFYTRFRLKSRHKTRDFARWPFHPKGFGIKSAESGKRWVFMSLFGKLKNRLMKTSSKLDEGLDAIVTEASANDAAEVAPEALPGPALSIQEPSAPEPDLAVEQDDTVTETPAPSVAVEPVHVEKAVEAAPVPVAEKPSLLGRMLGRKPAAAEPRRVLDDDMREQLDELLISTDMGVETSLRVTAAMAEGRFGKKLSSLEIKHLMAREIARIMEPVAKPMPIYQKTPQVVLVVGVNGSGTTTTIGKLASQFRAAGKNVVIAAGDTFRAAAVEQLQVWGERAGVPVLTAPEGSDPASLAFDAMTKAQESGADLLMIDTAGRLQNRADLMEELTKIVRVIQKKDPSAPHNTLLVLDATTGQNALNQVDAFQKLADVSGLVMTKLDGTAKGGVLVSLADKYGLPIHAIGVGEQIDDLAPFDPEDFAAALMGLEE
jgi:fused signal recognition particle receptor